MAKKARTICPKVARRLDIRGRSKMRKDELVDIIANADRRARNS
jgi:hypothetical protein